MDRNNDNRLCHRTEFYAQVEVQTKDKQQTLHGAMTDVSMFGAFLKVTETLPVNSLCDLNITISARNSRLVLEKIEGIVVRQEEEGIGIRFTSNMEWYALFNVYSCYGKYGTVGVVQE